MELILEVTGRVSLIRAEGDSSLKYQYNLVPNETDQAILPPPPIKYFNFSTSALMARDCLDKINICDLITVTSVNI